MFHGISKWRNKKITSLLFLELEVLQQSRGLSRLRPRSDLPALNSPGTAVWEGEALVLIQDTLVLRVEQEAVTPVLLCHPVSIQGHGAHTSPTAG